MYVPANERDVDWAGAQECCALLKAIKSAIAAGHIPDHSARVRVTAYFDEFVADLRAGAATIYQAFWLEERLAGDGRDLGPPTGWHCFAVVYRDEGDGNVH